MRFHAGIRWAVAAALLAFVAPARADVVIPTPPGLSTLAVNPITNVVYVLQFWDTPQLLTAVDRTAGTSQTVALPVQVSGNIVADPIQDRVYMANDTALVVVDGTTLAITTVPTCAIGGYFTVDPVANAIWQVGFGWYEYGFRSCRTDGSSFVSQSIDFGGNVTSALVDPTTHQAFYVADEVQVFRVEPDASSYADVTIAPVGARAVALNPHTRRLYVTPKFGDLRALDADTLGTVLTVPRQHVAARVDVVRDRVWISPDHIGATCGPTVPGLVGLRGDDLTPLDPAAGWTGCPDGLGPFNPATNRIYGYASSPPGVRIEDGDTFADSLHALAATPVALGVNVATNKLYATLDGIAGLVEIDEPEATPVPIVTTISSDPPTPAGEVTVHVSATSGFAPFAPPIDAIWLRVGGLQGPWTRVATGASGSTTLTLAPGTHTIHAFATDGQLTALSVQAIASPVVGQVASHEITIAATPACENGVDDDGDSLADFPDDPGCKMASWPYENPQCDNDLDDDADLAIDHPADAKCRGAWDNDEAADPGSCGLGAELALALALLGRARRRSRP